MINLILFFLFASLLLYVIFGGADFGAGILEPLMPKRDGPDVRNLTYQAIGPVWEANHIWLILVVVLLFVAFPAVYKTMSIHLHIPIMLALLGIILRGSAFAFRHYDAIKDGSQKIYSRAFFIGSLLTPLFLGMTAGATMLGRINPEADSFYAAYLAPWLNPFSFLVGLFFASICSFLAAVFLVGETEDLRLKELFFRQTIASNVVAVLSGLGVFISGQLMGINLLQLFLGEPFALGMVIISTLLVPFLWRNLGKGRKWLSRLFAGGIVGFILAAWLAVQFPDMVKLSDGAITIATSQAPPQVITAMGWALIAGSLLIFPSLYYLYRVFKLQ